MYTQNGHTGRSENGPIKYSCWSSCSIFEKRRSAEEDDDDDGGGGDGADDADADADDDGDGDDDDILGNPTFTHTYIHKYTEHMNHIQ